MTETPAIPRYKMVRDHIVRNIRSGRWKADSKIPSENEFVKELGVSRMTVNRALRELTAEGVLRRVQGVGSFVAGPQPQSVLLELRNIADEIRSRGNKHHSELLLLGKEEASEEVAEDMNISQGDAVFHSILVHYENDIPVQLENRYVNATIAPGYMDVDLTKVTPNEYLVKTVPADEVEHIVEATLPSEFTRRHLQMGEKEPCLLLHRRTWSSGQVVSKARLSHPGSRYRLGAYFQSSPNRPTGD
ncbi:histidine utilization repressor [Aestuariispira ectoiniformans]|uniref:histidine utilization repressor n=1 Tax=Aestuariispira ectoiniformans TaxID=2775080 RepID=UPI00223B9FB1|nr:histidine utilization repressor [Aestuariispira ectoiniformans]